MIKRRHEEEEGGDRGTPKRRSVGGISSPSSLGTQNPACFQTSDFGGSKV